MRAVVITPTYNNDVTLIDVLDQIEGLKLPLIIVNDGSTDRTAALIDTWVHADRTIKIVVCEHASNRGKADAMRTGFARAIRDGFTHGITMDTDGQLDVQSIRSLLHAAKSQPCSLIIGSRHVTVGRCPKKNTIGKRFVNLFIWIECGVRVVDSQCGLRVYPLGLISAVDCRSSRFNFETEIITRAGWAKCPVVHVPVNCKYFPKGQRVSHYRPWVDSWRCVWLHIKLLSRALLPWPSHPVWPQGRKPQAVRAGRWHQRLWQWGDPRKMWQALRGTSEQRGSLAAGFAAGAFIANTPFYGFHILISLYVAKRLSLHPLAVVAGSGLSTPPLGPILVAVAIVVGHLLLHGSWPQLGRFDLEHVQVTSLLGQLLLEWVLGGLIVGFVCMILVFFIVLLVLKMIPPRQSDEVAGSE